MEKAISMIDDDVFVIVFVRLLLLCVCFIKYYHHRIPCMTDTYAYRFIYFSSFLFVCAGFLIVSLSVRF